MSARSGHIPERTCRACRIKGPKERFVRIVRTPSGDVIVDVHGRNFGRGAYICKNKECLAKAMKKKSLSRGLGVSESSIPYDELTSVIAGDSLRKGEHYVLT